MRLKNILRRAIRITKRVIILSILLLFLAVNVLANTECLQHNFAHYKLDIKAPYLYCSTTLFGTEYLIPTEELDDLKGEPNTDSAGITSIPEAPTTSIANGSSCDDIQYDKIGIDDLEYKRLFADDKITDSEREFLYRDYYNSSPSRMRIVGTLYGHDINAIGELLQYGLWIRQQMDRGWVLIGSGLYGYRNEIRGDLSDFIKKYYNYKNPNDTLLSKQKSPAYFYYADGGINWDNRDSKSQPIPVSYEELNDRQERVFDLTVESPYKMKRDFFTSIDEQSKLSPDAALKTGKYIGVVSTKSINDFGRRLLLYSCTGGATKFIGVVVVGGEAKRDDWTGLGSPTSSVFDFKHFPLSTRRSNGFSWGMDVPTSIYEELGGTGSYTSNFIAIDPD